MRRRTDARQRRQDVDVNLAGMCFGCDGVGVLEPAQLGDAFIRRLYFLYGCRQKGLGNWVEYPSFPFHRKS